MITVCNNHLYTSQLTTQVVAAATFQRSISMVGQSDIDERQKLSWQNFTELVQTEYYLTKEGSEQDRAIEVENRKKFFKDIAQKVDEILKKYPNFANCPIENNMPLSCAIMNNNDALFDVLNKYRAAGTRRARVSDTDIDPSIDIPVGHLAAHYGNVHALKRLLQKNPKSVFAVEPSGQTTMFHQSLLRNNEILDISLKNPEQNIKDILKLLLHKNLFKIQDNAGRTPLHLAFGVGLYDECEAIMQVVTQDSKKKDYLWLVDYQGYTAFDYALQAVLTTNNQEKIDIFYKYVDSSRLIPKNIVLKILKKDTKKLHLSKILDNILFNDNNFFSRVLVEVIISCGININDGINIYGETLLNKAIVFGSRNVAKLLLENYANVNARDHTGGAPLHYSVRHDFNPDILIDYGANVNARDNNGDTPLHIAMCDRKLYFAKFLIDHGADVNAQDYEGNTPLHTAIAADNYYFYDNEEITLLDSVRLLIENGADPNVRNYNGNTPSDIVREDSDTEVMLFL